MTAGIILLALCLTWVATAQQSQTSATPQRPSHVHKSKRSGAAKAHASSASKAAEAVLPPPEVIYENGLLTIKAQNSSLHDILDLVHARIGATINAPVDLSQKVATQLGPAAPGKVLGDLLDQAGFDYMILGAPGNPNAISEIRVQPRAKETVETGARVQAEPAGASANPQDIGQPGGNEGTQEHEDPSPPKEEDGAQAPTPPPQPEPQPSPKPPDR